MSQVAGLYVVPESAIGEIRGAATPQKAGWFGKPKDTFWQTLWTHAGKSRIECEWSGYAFVVLFEYLRDRGFFDVAPNEKAELAEFLSKARRSYFLTFTPGDAAEFARTLSQLELREDDVRAYALEFCGPEEQEEMATALIGAARVLPASLEGVVAGTVGLLSIG